MTGKIESQKESNKLAISQSLSMVEMRSLRSNKRKEQPNSIAVDKSKFGQVDDVEAESSRHETTKGNKKQIQLVRSNKNLTKKSYCSPGSIGAYAKLRKQQRGQSLQVNDIDGNLDIQDQGPISHVRHQTKEVPAVAKEVCNKDINLRLSSQGHDCDNAKEVGEEIFLNKELLTRNEDATLLKSNKKGNL